MCETSCETSKDVVVVGPSGCYDYASRPPPPYWGYRSPVTRPKSPINRRHVVSAAILSAPVRQGGPRAPRRAMVWAPWAPWAPWTPGPPSGQSTRDVLAAQTIFIWPSCKDGRGGGGAGAGLGGGGGSCVDLATPTRPPGPY